MKYTIESTQTGCIETLEIDGRTYQKETERTDFGCRCKDREFYEQMEGAGFDEYFLEEICDIFDGFMALNFIQLSEV